MLRGWGGNFSKCARILPAVAAALVLALPASADQWEKKFTVTGTPEVSVRAGDSHVKVQTWEQKQVSAQVVTEGWRIADNEVQVLASQTGDRVEIEIRVPRWDMHWGIDRRSIHVDLMIPREATLAVRTSDGHIAVTDLTGKVDLETSDGHVTLADIHGAMQVRTSDGHIEGSGLDGKLEAGTSDGRIRVRGRFDLLDLHTSDGSIEADVLPGSQLSNTWSLRTSDGSISLRIPESLNAEIDAHTRDGHIQMGLPLTVSGELGRSTIHGKLNAGGPVLRLRTSDGHIRVDRL